MTFKSVLLAIDAALLMQISQCTIDVPCRFMKVDWYFIKL